MTAGWEKAKAAQGARNHTFFRLNDKPSAQVRLLGMKKVANSV
jgi:hypothetical protein